MNIEIKDVSNLNCHIEAARLLAQFTEQSGLKFAVQNVESRPDKLGVWNVKDKLEEPAHYTFTVFNACDSFSGFYSKGIKSFSVKQFRKYASGWHTSESVKAFKQYGPIKNVIVRGHYYDVLKKMKAKEKPTDSEILSALFMDSSNANQSFKYWACDLGYDDSIKAKDIWEQCLETHMFLSRVFTPKQYEYALELSHQL